MVRLARSLALVVLVGSSSGCARLAPLENPAPIAVTTVADPAHVRQAILMALPRRRWIPENEWPGVIVARLDIRSHQARVRIDYDASSVRVAYVDSVNLDFAVDSGGAPYIHPNYNVWARNLAGDIASSLASTAVPVVVQY